MNFFSNKTKKAFTLLELIIVIAILGILFTTVAINGGRNLKDARVARAQADAATIANAVQIYIQQNDSVPATTARSLDSYTTAMASASNAYVMIDFTKLTGTTSVNGVTYGPWLDSVPKSAAYANSAATATPVTGNYIYGMDKYGNVVCVNNDGAVTDMSANQGTITANKFTKLGNAVKDSAILKDTN